jgi:hypothetical protein
MIPGGSRGPRIRQKSPNRHLRDAGLNLPLNQADQFAGLEGTAWFVLLFNLRS